MFQTTALQKFVGGILKVGGASARINRLWAGDEEDLLVIEFHRLPNAPDEEARLEQFRIPASADVRVIHEGLLVVTTERGEVLVSLKEPNPDYEPDNFLP